MYVYAYLYLSIYPCSFQVLNSKHPGPEPSKMT